MRHALQGAESGLIIQWLLWSRVVSLSMLFSWVRSWLIPLGVGGRMSLVISLGTNFPLC